MVLPVLGGPDRGAHYSAQMLLKHLYCRRRREIRRVDEPIACIRCRRHRRHLPNKWSSLCRLGLSRLDLIGAGGVRVKVTIKGRENVVVAC